jgi:chemotaxis protein MotB
VGRKHKHPEHINHERWMVSFADFMTLLFALFVVLFAVSQVDERKYQQLASSMEKAFGVLPNHSSGLEEENPGGAKSIIPPVMVFQAMDDSKDMQRELEQKLTKKINQEFSKEGVALRKDERGLIIELKSSQLFESGSATLRPQAIPMMKKLTGEIEKMRRVMRIEGHTDNVPLRGGRYGSNWELSSARAGTVLHFLLDNSKIPPVNMSMAGYAEFRPIASNATPAGRSRNRRVDIVLMNNKTVKSEEPSANRNHTQISDSLNKELQSRLLSGRQNEPSHSTGQQGQHTPGHTDSNHSAPAPGNPATDKTTGTTTPPTTTPPAAATDHPAPTSAGAGTPQAAKEHTAKSTAGTPQAAKEHTTKSTAGTPQAAKEHTTKSTAGAPTTGSSLEKQLESKISGHTPADVKSGQANGAKH